MDPKKLFPDVPPDLTGLGADDLETYADSIRARILEVKEMRAKAASSKEEDRTQAAEFFGDLSTTDVMAQAQTAVAEFERVNDAIATQVLAQTELDQGLEDLVAKVTPAEVVAEEADPDPDPDPDVVVEAPVEAPVAEVVVEAPVEEVIVEEAPVAVVAAAARLPRPRAEHAPIEVAAKGTALVASAGIKGYTPGQTLTREELADATIKALHGGTIAQGSQKVLVASADWGSKFPSELKLGFQEPTASIMAKIEAAYGETALQASGGLCAPVTPYYELMNVAVADRPVRDALANFNAVRGGLQFAAPPTIADITGVGIKTAEEDALGGTFATKTCQIVACPDFSTVDVEMIYHCLQFGNLNARAFPELIATYNDLVLAAHARLAEQSLLDGITAFSTAVADNAEYGATSTLVAGILKASAAIRFQLRMAAGARLRVILPTWVADLLVNDTVNTQFGRFEYARDSIAALLDRLGNVTVSWTLDTTTGGPGFGAQAAGALAEFPTTVQWWIFPEGSFLFLDGGTLDLGIVRDSTLNATNDFQIFGETFENVAFVGPMAYVVTSTICPSGAVANPVTAITC